MKVLILLFFIIVPFSFQSIQAAFFCEDVLPSVFLIDQSTGGKTYLDKGRSTEWTTANIFTNLQAEQGDKIEINCDSNYGDGSTCGGGCFLINNICQCYDFSVRSNYFQIVERSTSLGGKQCYLPLKRFDFDGGIYTYTYRIPLDARGVTCPSVVLIFRYGKNYDINFLKYITTNFVPKNLEISITDKYKYFELNGVKLDSNNRFNIDNNLIFNSIYS